MNVLSTAKARRLGILFIAVLVVAYGFLEQHLAQIRGVLRESVATSPALAMTSKTVPQQIQDQVIAGVGNVPVDQIVFFSLKGNGVGVYATVNLGYATGPITAHEMSKIRQDINTWFTDVYGNNLPVVDAEVYFEQDGRTVAGAGLGIDAYKALTTRTNSGPGKGIAGVLAETRQVSGEGVNESWLSAQSS